MKVVVRCQAYFTAPATPEYFEANALTTIRSDVSGASYLFADIPIEFDAVNVDCGSRKAFVRPRDAFLVQPVAGLAGNLFNAQAYLNYDGTIPLLAGATKPLPGSVVNIRGAIAEWAMMRTPVTGCDINLDGGSAAVAVGTLSRQPANSLLDKFQRAVSGRILKL